MSKHDSSSPKPSPDEVNRANQLNPDHDAYWQSRGQDGRPGDDEGPAAPQQAPQTPSKD